MHANCRSFVSRWWLQDCRPDLYRVIAGDEPEGGTADQECLLESGPELHQEASAPQVHSF